MKNNDHSIETRRQSCGAVMLAILRFARSRWVPTPILARRARTAAVSVHVNRLRCLGHVIESGFVEIDGIMMNAYRLKRLAPTAKPASPRS